MSKQASKTLIGVFVLGAAVLFVATVLVLGGGKFLKKTQPAVMFFDGSIKGLSVGAPVMFRGVKIGSVTDIRLILDARDLSANIPVIIELEPERWTLIGGEKEVGRMKSLIERGLRGQLQMQSILTGQLMVAMDFFPGKPARFVGKVTEYPEIPTVPAPLAELTKTIEKLPLKEIADNLNRALDGIDKLVNSPDMKENVKSIHVTLEETTATLKETRAALKEVRELVVHVDSRVDPLMADIHGVAADTRDSLRQSQKTMVAIEGSAGEVAASAKKSLESADAALRQAEKTLAGFSGNSQLVHEVEGTLRDLSEASRSIQDFFDYLERHPEALIKGKPKPEGGTK